ncbi:MAG TPA: hypothetical protein PKW90_20330 [Myxococcota bacterium]|nr:hypothetical protein [Myxococcota bacterium]
MALIPVRTMAEYNAAPDVGAPFRRNSDKKPVFQKKWGNVLTIKDDVQLRVSANKVAIVKQTGPDQYLVSLAPAEWAGQRRVAGVNGEYGIAPLLLAVPAVMKAVRPPGQPTLLQRLLPGPATAPAQAAAPAAAAPAPAAPPPPAFSLQINPRAPAPPAPAWMEPEMAAALGCAPAAPTRVDFGCDGRPCRSC